MPLLFALFCRRRTFVVLAMGLWHGVLHAGADVWTTLPIYGGVVQVVAVDPTNSNILYVGTQGSGAYKSVDSGSTWEPASGGLEEGDIQTLAIDPSDPNRLYAGTAGAGVYRSTDGGDTWQSVNSGLINLSVYRIAIDPVTTTTLYAATFGNLFTSTDGADSWQALGTPTAPGAGQNLYDSAAYDVVVVPNTPSTLFVATHARGVFKYAAGGWSTVWSDTRGGNPNPLINNVRALTVDATGNEVFIGTQGLGLFKSIDGGATWPTQINNASGLTTSILRTMAMLPGNVNTIYAGASSGFYYSSNGGAAWTESATSLNPLSIAIDPNNVAIVYVGTDQGLYKSTDGGINFTAQNNGLVNLKVRGIAIDPTDSTRRYVAVYGGGVMRTADSGATWNYANTGLPSKDALSIAVGTRDSSSRTIIVGLDTTGAYQSIDDGSVWSTANTGLPSSNVSHVIAEQTTPNHFFAGGHAGVVSTFDASGVGWDREINGVSGNDYLEVNALAVDPSDPETVWSGISSRGIFRGMHDADGILAWTPVNVGFTGEFVSAIAVDPTDSNVVYAGTEGRGMFKTIDQGATWAQSIEGMGEVVVNSVVIDPNSPTTLYASTQDNGVFKSTNAGDTWVAINDGMEISNVTTLALISDTTPPTLYAGTDGDGLIEIQSTVSSPAPALIGGDDSGGGSSDAWLVLLSALGFIRRRSISAKIH